LSNVIKSRNVMLKEQKLITPHKPIATKVSLESKKEKLEDTANIISKISMQNHILEAERIISSAKAQAAEIIQKAKEEAEKEANAISEEICAKAKEQGYKDGMDEAALKATELEAKLKADFESMVNKQEEEYMNLIKELEPNLAQILIKLIEKITGVIVKNNQVIEYLINKALTNSAKSSQYIIRVSEDDYETVSLQKDRFRSLVDEDVKLDISIDKSLEKNQCIIDTDFGLIDCSLDVQLENLYKDIELLVLND